MKIVIDQDRCTGHGMCEAIAEDIFEIRKDGIAHLLREVTPDDLDSIEAAVDQCPARALSLIE